MRHRVGGRQLNRNSNQRRSLFRNLANSLILHEKIITTEAKAKSVKPMVEKLVTKAKVDSLHNRRMLLKELVHENSVKKMLEVIGPKFKERPGGYTKIVKMGPRAGDKANMVALLFVEDLSVLPKKEIKHISEVEKTEVKEKSKKVVTKETAKKTTVKKAAKEKNEKGK